MKNTKIIFLLAKCDLFTNLILMEGIPDLVKVIPVHGSEVGTR